MTREAVIIGAGAAGLAAAIFAKRRHPELSVTLLDGATKPGAKILVSGGGRCNVTNTVVAAEDFQGGSRNVVRRLLREFDAPRAAAFFLEIGVPLHEEPGGKLFPDSNRARTVLDALLAEADRRGVRLIAGRRVTEVRKGFHVITPEGVIRADRVVLATGGMSLPKTGSDGGGYRIAQSLGHSIVPTTPALVPLLVERGFHADLAGVSLDVEIAVRVAGAKPERIRGALLWTHFGVSGPATLDASRTWLRARLEKRDAEIRVSFLPGETVESADAWIRSASKDRPTTSLSTVLSERVPARLADRLIAAAGLDAVRMAHLPKDGRRLLVESLVEHPLAVSGSRGYNYAEVTAGGVPLDEVDPRTLESRKCPGLHLVGEILDVDGRIGGFNFQWAWATGWVCGGGLG